MTMTKQMPEVEILTDGPYGRAVGVKVNGHDLPWVQNASVVFDCTAYKTLTITIAASKVTVREKNPADATT